ncbi:MULTISPECIES: terminase ATPase subunit family protein [Photorhabdus]|uniref:terminase ATPase subunit family protein n=1 Tax=Photorhabdus TaxID=29487 RepID=UPI000DCB4E3F|nr:MULTISPECIES: terminase ATPase subunit family protein [Photorhabdus]AXG45006.1 oxidoreductase [Photorhabdus laumondii subsp. laumondii]NDL17688.1 oxidoreductase [Photorhabdus laumondii subsp. laumondii]NDL49437.1 oxidoreductase [Photorhabdus laumondii subsp. laumondii]NDL54031.1 oxidoreductase [Photorhabdus laumondii subsp. laumondii]RAW82571.1 oxidoreductase [Photorhabdus sp. S5P8-50]
MKTTPDFDPRKHAMHLYFNGYRIARIAEMLNEKASTIHSWKRRDKWDEVTSFERVELSLEARLCQLIAKEQKEGKDFKEIDLLHRQLERQARIRKYSRGGNEADLNPKIANRNKGERRPPEKNVFSEEQVKKLEDIFRSTLFDYQHDWYHAGLAHRIRNILKSRQIGATFFFAREALIDALTTGRNQIFLSASKAQAHVFKQYILEMAREVDAELKGDPITLNNGATLYFLGTNARTAQSYHGNLYLDEYFWIPKFQELRKVASGMAMHKKWHQTYFSTPSSLTHSAYPYWSGKLFNRGRAKANRIDIDISHQALANGLRCADGQWRQIVTVEDAVRGGCNLFDIDQLRLEYSPDEYQNLLMCEFMDDIESIFSLQLMQGCMVDSWEIWDDVQPLMLRPYGYYPVWIGYDPAKGGENGDSAGCVVVAPPRVPGGKFRILERHQWRGMNFRAQSDAIKRLTEQYNVEYIGIDSTGVGHGVYQNVKEFFPSVREFVYNPAVKNALVLKAWDIINHRRLEFDAGQTDIAQSFMAIRRSTTASGNRPTYQASRSEEASHADLAWATMHALFNEPITGDTPHHRNIVEVY